MIEAVIEDGAVVNTILWDGESGWAPDDNQTVVEIADVPEGEQHAGIGWKYTDGVFIPPPEVVIITPESGV